MSNEHTVHSLTAHLRGLAQDEVHEAMHHPFLRRAATSTLPLEELQAWLGQDRLYAYSYVHFIGTILSRVSIQTQNTLQETLPGRYISTLIDCLTNIQREIKLFEDTAAEEGWLEAILTARPSIHTRAYQDLFAGVVAPHRPLLASVVALWATEWCYFRAWSRAASMVPRDRADRQLDVMQRTFIPNWSSPEFEAFVDKLGRLVDEFGALCEPGGSEWVEAEDVWRQVVWAEKNFWPNVEGAS